MREERRGRGGEGGGERAWTFAGENREGTFSCENETSKTKTKTHEDSAEGNSRSWKKRDCGEGQEKDVR